MARLWRCTFSVEMVVEADDAREAQVVAQENLPDAAEGDSKCLLVWELVTPLGLPSGWHSAYPYNGDGERTCEEILKAALDGGERGTK